MKYRAALLPAFAATMLFAGLVEIGGPLPEPLPLFPADNWWNTDISSAPVEANSAAYIKFINNGSPRPLHPDFGSTVSPNSVELYGFPYMVVGADQSKKTVYFDNGDSSYGDQSDGVDHATGQSIPFYPIPDEAATQPHWIEGGQPGNVDLRSAADRHMLIVDRDNRLLYELYNVFYDGTRWHGGSGAFFDMKTNNRRPEGWTSSDAAGLAILPGLIRHDELFGGGEIGHAFRVTVRATNGYVYPASHRAGSNPSALPMGARLRLKSGVSISGFSAELQKLFRAFKKYGLIVADNGADMYIGGTFDTRWVNGAYNADFSKLTANDFEVIKLGWQPPQLTYFPHVASGGGFTTAVTLANTGTGTAAGSLVVTDPSGSTRYSESVTIPAAGTRVVTLHGAADSATATGWARFESIGGLVGGLATFQFRRGGSLLGTAGVFASVPVSTAVIPVDNDDVQSRYTGFAAANPGSESLSISITLKDGNGATIATIAPERLNPLGAGRQVAVFLHELLASAGTFRGSMTLASTDGAKFIVVALVQNRGLYTAIPVL